MRKGSGATPTASEWVILFKKQVEREREGREGRSTAPQGLEHGEEQE